MLGPILIPIRRSAGVLWLLIGAALVVVVILQGATAASAAPSASSQPGSGAKVPYYVVPGSPGQQSNVTLGGVAQRTLGSSNRWRQIYVLNQTRPQPGGAPVPDDANVPLQSGSVLVLPADASSGEIHIGAPPSVAPAATAPPGQQRVQVKVLGQSPAVAGLVGGLLLLLVVVAGGVVAIVWRRRRPGTGVPGRGQLPSHRARSGASAAGAPDQARGVLDRALRMLATQIAPDSPAQPQVYAAVVGPDKVSLRLTPPLEEAPAPWQVREQGSIWQAPNWQLDSVLADRDQPRFPLLVPVGTIDGEWTTVNLGRAPGLIALTGDPAAAARIAGRLVDAVAADPNAAQIEITVLGALPRIQQPERVRIASGVPDLVPGAGGHSTAPGANTRAAAGVMLRRQLIVVTIPLPSADLEWLGALAAQSDNTAAVLVVGDAATAAWRIEVGSDESLDIGVLGLQLDAPELTRGLHLVQHANRK